MEILSAISHRPHAKPKAVFKVLTASLLISTSILASPVSWASVASAASPSAGITYEQEFGSLEMELPAAPVHEISFSDVREGAYYEEAVLEMASQGIIAGVGDNRFDPTGKLTAAQVVKLAVAARTAYYGLEAVEQGEGNDWARPYYDYAVANDMLGNSGITLSNLNSAEPITRGAMFELFANVLDAADYPEEYDMADAPEQTDNQAIQRLYKAGVVIGDGTGFAAERDIQRCDAALILQRVLALESGGSSGSGSGDIVVSGDMDEGSGYIIDGYEFTNYQIEMCKLLNEARRADGLPELRLDPDLCKAADQLALEYAQGAHADKRKDGRDVGTVMDDLGLRKSPRNRRRCICSNAPEGTRETAEQQHAGWMNSDDHRDLRMAAPYAFYGVSRVQWDAVPEHRTDSMGKSGTKFWVELLALEEGKDLETLEVH